MFVGYLESVDSNLAENFKKQFSPGRTNVSLTQVSSPKIFKTKTKDVVFKKPCTKFEVERVSCY